MAVPCEWQRVVPGVVAFLVVQGRMRSRAGKGPVLQGGGVSEAEFR